MLWIAKLWTTKKSNSMKISLHQNFSPKGIKSFKSVLLVDKKSKKKRKKAQKLVKKITCKTCIMISYLIYLIIMIGDSIEDFVPWLWSSSFSSSLSVVCGGLVVEMMFTEIRKNQNRRAILGGKGGQFVSRAETGNATQIHHWSL